VVDDFAPADLAFDQIKTVEHPPTDAILVETIPRNGATVHAVATLKTGVFCPGRTLDDVKVVLAPENWLRCFGDWWREMRLVDPANGRPHYREKVSGKVRFLTVEVCLQFVQSEGPGVAVLDYMMCDVDAHQPVDCRVTVDEGWILAEQFPNGVRVTTSKRVRFNDPIGGESLVVAADSLGYGAVARDLVSACLDCDTAVRNWSPVEAFDGS
jgi:hypothetical protein